MQTTRLPVASWFNGAAPRVKCGEIVPASLTPEAALAQAESDVRTVLRVAAAGAAARVRIDAGSVDNPFTNRSWRQFRCGF